MQRGASDEGRGRAAEDRTANSTRLDGPPRIGRVLWIAALLIGAVGCFGGPPPVAPRAPSPFDFAGTPCDAKPPTKACCEAAAKRTFIHLLADDDGTGDGRYGIPGEFDDNSFTLLPGRPVTLTFAPKAKADFAAFAKALAVTHLRRTYAGR